MSEELIKVLDELTSRFDIAIDWTSENVLPYAQQLMEKYINYEIATSVAWVVFIAVILSVCAIITRVAWKRAIEVKFNENEIISWIACIGLIVSIFLSLVFIFVFAVQMFDIITCATFSEKVIYEFLKIAAN